MMARQYFQNHRTHRHHFLYFDHLYANFKLAQSLSDESKVQLCDFNFQVLLEHLMMARQNFQNHQTHHHHFIFFFHLDANLRHAQS